MVKADVRRNYYADLELGPNADNSEISKQFRKLAKLYHPDRNQGQEEEFIPKFQAIQAAYEILSDPETRAKYDKDRKKQGFTPFYARPNNTTRNPYASGFARSTKFYEPDTGYRPPGTRPFPTSRPQYNPKTSRSAPAPPQQSKPNPNTYSAYSAYNPPPPSTGANRFSNFARPPPPPPSTAGSKEDARARANAFQNMRHAPPPPRPSNAAEADFARAQRAANDTANAHTAKPGLGRSNTTKTPRKSGFDPSDPTAEWEPQAVRYSSYSSYASSARPAPQSGFLSADGSVPPPPPPTQTSTPTGEKNSADSVPFSEGKPRVRTPYMQHLGEKTYFSSDSIRRSASVRDAPSFAAEAAKRGPNMGTPTTTPPPRPRSTSPSFGSKLSGEGQPRSTSEKSRTEKKATLSGARRTDFEIGGLSDSSDGESSAFEPPSEDAGPFGKHARRKAQPGGKWANRNGAKTAPNMSPVDGQSKTDIPIFNIPVTPQHTRSTESINTQFSASAWNGKFEGSDSFAPPPPSSRRSSKAKNSPLPRRAPTAPKSAGGAHWFDMKDTAPPQSANGTQDEKETEQRPAGPVKFSSEEWSEKFKEASFVLPQKPRSTSPVKPPQTPGRKPSRPQTRRMSKPPPPTVEDDSSSTSSGDKVPEFVPGAPLGKSARAPTVANDDSMDIDTPPNGTTPEPKGPRLVPVQPTRPDWRSPQRPPFRSSSSAIPSAVPQANRPPPPPPPPPAGAAAKARAATTPDRKSKGSNVTSTGQQKQYGNEQGTNLNMKEFENIAPFTPSSGAGISDLDDLSNNLPFKSQPAPNPFISTKPQELVFPQVPKGPDPPAAPYRGITHSAWKTYVSRFSVYMGEWHKFDSIITNHFNSRNLQAARFGTGLPSTKATRLLEMKGETIGGEEVGIQSYYKTLCEDEPVRRKYNIAYMRHMATVEAFVEFKKRVDKEGLLPDKVIG